MKEKLVKKLYSLYDFDRVIYAITKKEETENIYNLIQAIKQQKQVVLKEYKSGHGKDIRDRIVEPIDFTINYLGVWCYDTEDHRITSYNVCYTKLLREMPRARTGSVHLRGRS